jgi:CxxC-x17-CxxC domain-containing protein
MPGFQGGFGGERKMHKATCSECGTECEVPFEPKADRPVYCRDCYMKRKR